MGRRTLLLLASILVAAVGTALIWVYVQNADARAQAVWGSTRLVLRAREAIDPGASTLAIEQATELVAVPVTLVPRDAVGDVRAIAGRAPTVAILAGQLLQDGQFDPLPGTAGGAKGMVAVSVSVEDPNRVAGLLHPDLAVDVYVVQGDGAAPKAGGGSATGGSAGLLLQGVKVLAVGNTTVLRNAQGRPAQIGTQTGVAAAVVVLQVRPGDAARVILAAAQGTLWFTVPGEGVQLRDGAVLHGNDLLIPNG